MADDRDNSMLNIGKQCSHRTCLLVDFLPIKCQHCEQAYCSDHFLPQAHQCDKYDESKYNRIAPDCPFCKVPLAIRPGEDPNIRMERHFETDCPILVGKTAKSSTPRCTRANCGKVLFAPIRCDKCKQQFCPAHRFPADHKCVTSASGSKAFTPSSGASTPNSRAPTSAAAMAAIKRAMNNVNTSSSGASPQKKPPTSPSKPSGVPAPKLAASTSTKSAASASSSRSANPFSATDRPTPSSNTTSNDSETTTHDNATPNTAIPTPNAPSPAISLFLNPYVPRPIFASA